MGLQLKKQEAERIFNKLDIELKDSTHHISGYIKIDGKKVLTIFYSKGKGDMPGKIPEKFRKSLMLTLEEFIRLKECPMSKEEYYKLIKMRLP